MNRIYQIIIRELAEISVILLVVSTCLILISVYSFISLRHNEKYVKKTCLQMTNVEAQKLLDEKGRKDLDANGDGIACNLTKGI